MDGARDRASSLLAELGFDWGSDHLRFELAPRGRAHRPAVHRAARLDRTRPPATAPDGTCAWTRLEATLDGAGEESLKAISDDWRRHYDEYARRGFPATAPIPGAAADTGVGESRAVELGLRARACIVTGASRGIGRATALALAGEGASVLLRRAQSADAGRSGARVRRRGWPAGDVRARRHRSRRRRSRRHGVPRAVRPDRRSGQQRRHQLGPLARGADRRGLAGAVGAERDGADAADAGGRAGDGPERLGPDRQRLLVVGQAAGKAEHGVLGDQGGRALAVARVRRPVRVRGRAGQRGHAGPGREPICGWRPAGWPIRPPRRRGSAGTRRSRPPRAVSRSDASAPSRRSPR